LADYSIESGFHIQEIEVAGMLAYCWTQLTVTVLAKTGAVSARRSGTTLSIFRKGSDGKWLLARDANLLGPAS
jgi:ketosteroid isomerase-like protein